MKSIYSISKSFIELFFEGGTSEFLYCFFGTYVRTRSTCKNVPLVFAVKPVALDGLYPCDATRQNGRNHYNAYYTAYFTTSLNFKTCKNVILAKHLRSLFWLNQSTLT